MEAFTQLEALTAVMDRINVDTDQIIPSDWLKRVERTGFEKGLFSEWRDDRDFVLNQEQYAGANILIGGLNFGTGSSREHAPWSISGMGIRCIVSSSFADIFHSNCMKNGMLPVRARNSAQLSAQFSAQFFRRPCLTPTSRPPCR